jgi:eukaryotic-like serine/threonine-protein kinase
VTQTVGPPDPDGPPPLAAKACFAPGYAVIEHLRRGRLLDVYDVWSQARQCRCVAKLLRPDRLAEPAARRRLLGEGRRLARMSHPHIVRAYEVLEVPQPAVILETLTGATLGYLEECNPRGLGLSDVVVLGLQLCSAVHYLHGWGILHLDIKPSNIVCEGGTTKLLDLDVARRPGRSRRWGTRQYMAPEQAGGGMLSAATDVWGIGVVLFEAATGRLPFDFESDSGFPQLTRPAESIRRYRRVPAAFARAIEGALTPTPERRLALSELIRALADMGVPEAHWKAAAVG